MATWHPPYVAAAIRLRIGAWRLDRKFEACLWTCVALCLLIAVALCSTTSWSVEPDLTRYTLQLPESPPDGSTATQTYKVRATDWIQYLACGQENEFLNLAVQDPSTFIDDNILGRVMAKLAWLKLGNTSCEGTFKVVYVDGTTQDFYSNQGFPDAPTFVGRSMHVFGPDCSDTPAVFSYPGGTFPSFATVNVQISAACLKDQINFVLRQVQEGNSYPGTDGLPCNIEDDPLRTLHGDWDMRMKTLVRILYLDRSNIGDRQISVLAPDVRDHIQNDLLTVDGGPSPDSYSVTACGDNEKDTGTAQDREDEGSMGQTLLNSIGDALTWLLRRLAAIAAFLTALTILTLFSAIFGVPVAVLAPVGIATILSGRIPETENHRLMIESTRFLNNQLIIADLGANQSPYMGGGQSADKQWILNKFQGIAKHDFNEYNARPYHGFSLAALRNLADFSTDADVKTGSRMLLELSAAKFAVGSNLGRRLVPFRRHFAAVDCIDGNPCSLLNKNTSPAEMFNDYVQIGDSELPLGLLYDGQTQQLPTGSVAAGSAVGAIGNNAANPAWILPPGILGGLVPGAVGDALPAATSSFTPDVLITDLAIRKDVPYFQRIHNAAYEVYSSSPSVLITAGGIEAGHASSFSVGPVSLGISQSDDLGAGVPTTVMFTADSVVSPGDPTLSKMTLDEFISFRGTIKTAGGSETFTNNLCVWRNFACGVNLRIPRDIAGCLTGPKGYNLYFLDSATCAGYSKGPHFYMVLFLLCQQAGCLNPGSGPLPAGSSAGFVEVVDAPTAGFEDFQTAVVASNDASKLGGLGQGCLSGSNCLGTYRTASNHDLLIDLRGYADDSNSTGIVKVDNVSEKNLTDWNLAEGDIINSQGDGVIQIRNPRLNQQITLDFSNANHPCERHAANQPCVQP